MAEKVGNSILLSHFGHLAYDTIGDLLRMLDYKMKEMIIDEIIRKKIYAIIVECLENIDRHKNLYPDNLDKKFDTKFTLELKNNAFFVVTGNVIKNEIVKTLKNQLDMVNSLDEKGLKKLYRKTLLTGQISEKGGAGVGIIDMAKISRNKIKYNFESINNELSYYQIQLKINNQI